MQTTNFKVNISRSVVYIAYCSSYQLHIAGNETQHNGSAATFALTGHAFSCNTHVTVSTLKSGKITVLLVNVIYCIWFSVAKQFPMFFHFVET